MNQNKSNVPVSVAEEPDELSYYRLTLLSFLRESHPDLADDESFVATRSNHAAEAFSAAIRSGLTYDDAAQQGKYSINSLVYWVTYVHNVVYSFYRSMIIVTSIQPKDVRVL